MQAITDSVQDVYLTLCGTALGLLKDAGISPIMMMGGGGNTEFVTSCGCGNVTRLLRIELLAKSSPKPGQAAPEEVV